VRRLEELGIGRPSTWASIIQTIQDRGYVWKKGQALVPTWTAFAVVGLLEQHFDDLVDYEHTAKIEEDLDDIATGSQHKDEWLTRFYFGDDADLPGLKRLVEDNLDQIDAAAINTFRLGADPNGEDIVVKPGKYGPYVKRGDDTAGVPEDLPPDELTVDKALELLAMPKSDEPIGDIDGYPVYAKNGRYGPYVQWGDPDNLPPGLDKPKMASLFKTMTLERVTVDDAERLLQLPRALGDDPVDGKEIVANNGRYGPYIVKEKDFRTLDSEEQLFTITLEQAAEIFKLPKVFKRGAARNMAAAGPLREFGTDPVSERPVVARDGRFGVYVTDGETNASIGKGDRIDTMEPERAFELLAIRREQVAAKGGAPTKKSAAKRAAPKKKAAAKKSAAPRKQA
jgi:DNA topoisomerase-1